MTPSPFSAFFHCPILHLNRVSLSCPISVSIGPCLRNSISLCFHFLRLVSTSSFPVAPHLPVSVPCSLCPCPLPLGLCTLPLGLCSSLLGPLSPFFLWSMYPPISVPPSLGLCPHPSGSLFTPYLCFSLFLRLPQHPSLPAHLSLCTLVFPVSASTPAFCQSLPFNLLPKPHWEVRGRGNTQGPRVRV